MYIVCVLLYIVHFEVCAPKTMEDAFFQTIGFLGWFHDITKTYCNEKREAIKNVSAMA